MSRVVRHSSRTPRTSALNKIASIQPTDIQVNGSHPLQELGRSSFEFAETTISKNGFGVKTHPSDPPVVLWNRILHGEEHSFSISRLGERSYCLQDAVPKIGSVMLYAFGNDEIASGLFRMQQEVEGPRPKFLQPQDVMTRLAMQSSIHIAPDDLPNVEQFLNSAKTILLAQKRQPLAYDGLQVA